MLTRCRVFLSKVTHSRCCTNVAGLHPNYQPNFKNSAKSTPESSETSHESQEIPLLDNDIWQHIFSPSGKTKTFDHGENSFTMPGLEGSNIQEHFRNIALKQSKPYTSLMNKFVKADPPPMPTQWLFKCGWTKYELDGTTKSVPCPVECCFVFDVEIVMSQDLEIPTLAVALSDKHWYSWCSETLVNPNLEYCDRLNPDMMIPLDLPDKPLESRVVIAHNAGFDRAFVKEQYLLLNQKSGTRFWDTMAMHISYNGMTHDQLVLKKFNDSKKSSTGAETPQAVKDAVGTRAQITESEGILKVIRNWVNKACSNGLADVYQFYCGATLEKEDRQVFVKGSVQDVRDNFQKLMTYCANDNYATLKVFQKLFPAFKRSTPDPATYCGLLHMSNAILPVNSTWTDFMSRCQKIFDHKQLQVSHILNERAETIATAFDEHSAQRDPWLFKDLDWTQTRVGTKEKKSLPTVFDNTVLYPKWFVSLVGTNGHIDRLRAQMDVSSQLLRLLWKEQPIIRVSKRGYCILSKKFYNCENGMYELVENDFIELDDLELATMKKLPHPKGGDKNLGRLLTKDMMPAYGVGHLRSADAHGQDCLDRLMHRLKVMAYWISVNQRLNSQILVWLSENNAVIVPKMCVSGTVTRRAVEDTWLTASNSKSDKLGSEYKSLVQAPPGYIMVGADVDSQEQWIAALIGDSYYAKQNKCTPMHGLTPFINMLLMGKKENDTDQHSVVANKFGISRDAAKVINYGRLYGSGLRNIENILKLSAPEMETRHVKTLAARLLQDTKGKRNKTTKLWQGGSESDVFNSLEIIAEKSPLTPVLKVKMSKTLASAKGQFTPSKVNWVVQSSAVDFLHLLLVCMKWLCDKYDIQAVYCISIHDEIRYLVKDEDKYRCALALQYSNLLVRCMFSYCLGMNNLPQSVQWFSNVDVDSVLRKEPTSECITPSNPLGLSHVGIPPGEAITFADLLKKVNTLRNR